MADGEPSPFPFDFTYVRVPADDNEPFEELTGTATAPGDVLSSAICKAHFSRNGGIKDTTLLRAQYGDAVDEKMGALERVAAQGTVETFALVRPSKDTQPKPMCGTYLYLDEMGVLKALPRNNRASEIARACGLEVESPFHGDVYIGRVDIGASPVRVTSLVASELNAGSKFMLNAPSENYQTQQAMFEYEKVAKEKQLGSKTAEEQKAIDEERGWRWAQTAEDVEVTVTVPEGTTAKEVAVKFGGQVVSVALKRAPTAPLADLKLFAPIRTDECTWTVGNVDGGRAVQLTMEKMNAVTWDALEAASGGKLV